MAGWIVGTKSMPANGSAGAPISRLRKDRAPPVSLSRTSLCEKAPFRSPPQLHERHFHEGHFHDGHVDISPSFELVKPAIRNGFVVKALLRAELPVAQAAAP